MSSPRRANTLLTCTQAFTRDDLFEQLEGGRGAFPNHRLANNNVVVMIGWAKLGMADPDLVQEELRRLVDEVAAGEAGYTSDDKPNVFLAWQGDDHYLHPETSTSSGQELYSLPSLVRWAADELGVAIFMIQSDCVKEKGWALPDMNRQFPVLWVPTTYEKGRVCWGGAAFETDDDRDQAAAGGAYGDISGLTLAGPDAELRHAAWSPRIASFFVAGGNTLTRVACGVHRVFCEPSRRDVYVDVRSVYNQARTEEAKLRSLVPATIVQGIQVRAAERRRSGPPSLLLQHLRSYCPIVVPAVAVACWGAWRLVSRSTSST